MAPAKQSAGGDGWGSPGKGCSIHMANEVWSAVDSMAREQRRSRSELIELVLRERIMGEPIAHLLGQRAGKAGKA